MKEKLRNLLLLAFLALSVAPKAVAQDAVNTLVIERTDGSTATFLLADSPSISISGNELIARSTKSEVSVPVEDIADYHFISSTTGISDVLADGVQSKTDVKDGKIIFSNLKDGERVMIYTTAGTLVGSYEASSDGSLEIDLAAFGKGVLIVRSSQGSFKFLNK